MNPNVFLLVLAAAIGHAGWNFAARKVSGDLVVLWLAIGVGSLLLLPGAIAVVMADGLAGESTSAQAIACMIATGVIHAVYFALLGRAYAKGEISVVYPVARGSGIGLTAVLAWLLLGEEISWLGTLGIGLIVLGTLVMAAAAFGNGPGFRGFLLSLCVGATIVSYSLIDKVGVTSVHPIVYMEALGLIATASLGPFMLWRWRWEQLTRTARRQWHYVLMIGVGAVGTYLTVLWAMSMGPVSYIVAMREFAVVIGALLGIVVLKEKLTFNKAVAIASICLGLICIKAG